MTDSDDKDLFGEPVERLGAPLFAERWSNGKAARIGYLWGKGLSAPAICDELADGITPNTITKMTSMWDLPLESERRTYGPVKVMLAARHRTMIHAEAKRRDTDMAELIRRVAVATAQDDMWAAILDR